MDDRTKRVPPVRRYAAAAAAVCSVVVAIVGGALVATPAQASDITTSTSCAVGCIDPAPPAGALSSVTVVSSTDAVYPVKDGYLDGVRFAVTAMDAAGRLVPIEGTAVLSKAGEVAQAWTLDSPRTVLSWNGRAAGEIRRGVYTLMVTAYSSDGTTRSTQHKVRVLSKHVEQRVVTVDSAVRSGDTSASMPGRVLKAYAKGLVTVRLRTVAKVHGPARVIFRNNGVVRSLRLRDGVHTTKTLIAPKGFDRVTITHEWKSGAAELTSVKAIWTYYTLVD